MQCTDFETASILQALHIHRDRTTSQGPKAIPASLRIDPDSTANATICEEAAYAVSIGHNFLRATLW
jgi:hypothetical protein